MADTVMIADRAVTVVFAKAVNKRGPLPVAVAGLTLIQTLSDAATHIVLEVTVIVAVLPAMAAIAAVFADTSKVTGAAVCVTVIVCVAVPVADTLMVAERLAGTVFANAVNVSVPLPVADAGLTVSQA